MYAKITPLALVVLLVGCANNTRAPVADYQPAMQPAMQPAAQEMMLDKKTSPLSRGEQIEAMNECRANELRPRIIYARRIVNGQSVEIVLDIICAPKFM
jgi:PBP1b-binding outer membrane lipoprotein LpoB